MTPLLISLPHGLDLGGVTTWAVRLANALVAAEGGRPVAIIAHPSRADQPRAPIEIDPRVTLLEPRSWPIMGDVQGDLSPFLPLYRDTLRRLAIAAGSPAVMMPNILGDSYGLAAALAMTNPETLRVIAWQHSDSPYDTSLLIRFEPVIARFVAIDDRYAAALRARLPHRTEAIAPIPHGVPVSDQPPADREPLRARPVRLVYTGRIEHRQKRITALAHLARELQKRSIPHELRILGDGPAVSDLDALLASTPSARRLPAGDVTPHLQWADAFVLPSRFEGLCISRIEAMAAGCVPIVTTADSGAGDGITPGLSGEFIDAAPADDDVTTASRAADAVARFLSRPDPRAMARAAWTAARERFSLAAHARAVGALIDQSARDPAPRWRASWPCAFSFSADSPGGSGSVPADGAARLRRLLASLQGRRIVLHGAGRHTIELASVLAEATILAVTDDDQSKHGRTFLGWPIIAPQDAGPRGATDVIISSWIHADEIWSRRAVYERQGLRVHSPYRD